MKGSEKVEKGRVDEAAQELAASEVRYRRLFEAAKDGILILDAGTGMVVDVNPFLMELLGYSREDFLDKRVWELGFFKNLAANEEKFMELQARDYVRYDNLPLETADGRVREVEFVSNVYLADGKRVIQCNIRDITERKRAESRIVHLNQVLRAIRSVNLLITHETDRNVLLRRACEILISTRGYRSAWVALRNADGKMRAVGETGNAECFADVKQALERGDWPECCRLAREAANGIAAVQNSDRNCKRCALSRASSDITALAGALRHDHRDYGVLVVVLPAELGDDSEEQSLFRELVGDLSYALHAMDAGQARIRSNRTLQAIFQSASDGILLADAETGRFILGNEAMCRLLGYSPEEIAGLSVADIHPADVLAYVLAQFEKQARGEISLVPDLPVKRKDGTVFQADVNTGVFELDGRRHVAGFFRDITERQGMEAQLRHAQKLKSIGTLAGGVAHEINNPVMGIMNYAQLILDKLGPEHEVAEYAREIGHETERVAAIVKNLLLFSRQDKQAHSPARICDIVEGTLSLVRAVLRHDQIALAVDVPEDLPTIKCRSQQIQQVIMNLITNARDALNQKYPGYDDNKKISVSSTVFDKDGSRWVRTTVTDTGPGIPDHIRERMYEPFYTTKPAETGTGLGLSISHSIIKEHDGCLTVETKPGEWTRFHVDLPTDSDESRGTRSAERDISGGGEPLNARRKP